MSQYAAGGAFLCSTARWKAEGAEAEEAKKMATAAYCSLCPVVLQMIARQPCPELLAPLVSLAERGPQFFRNQHGALLGAIRTILANSSSVQTEETRRMALQLAAAAFLGAPKFSKKVRASSWTVHIHARETIWFNRISLACVFVAKELLLGAVFLPLTGACLGVKKSLGIRAI